MDINRRQTELDGEREKRSNAKTRWLPACFPKDGAVTCPWRLTSDGVTPHLLCGSGGDYLPSEERIPSPSLQFPSLMMARRSVLRAAVPGIRAADREISQEIPWAKFPL